MAQVQAVATNVAESWFRTPPTCERCGERTRRARRLVRIALRVEVLFFLMVGGA